MKIIYIAGFRQHAGKTFTSLGIISELLKYLKPEEIGYIKPVGQELYKLPNGKYIDKDARIVEQFVLPEIDMEHVSPIRIGNGVTKEYLKSDSPEAITKSYIKSLNEAMETLKDKKVVVAEGTGHPGVGGIVNLSNSDVCKLLGSEVIYLAGGGLGRTLDMLELDFTYFRYAGAKISGVIFNKLIPEKINQMREVITEKLLTDKYSSDGTPIKIFGFMPVIEGLNMPSMRLIAERYKSDVSDDIENDHWNRPISSLEIISQPSHSFEPSTLQPGSLVVISYNSVKRLKALLDYNSYVNNGMRISGLLLTCVTDAERVNEIKQQLQGSNIPAIFTHENTSLADEKIYNIIKNTKLQAFDFDKFEKIKDSFDRYFDTESLLSSLGLK